MSLCLKPLTHGWIELSWHKGCKSLSYCKIRAARDSSTRKFSSMGPRYDLSEQQLEFTRRPQVSILGVKLKIIIVVAHKLAF